MKSTYTIAIVASLLIVFGCSSSQPAPESGPSPTQVAANKPTEKTDLGSQKDAGPYKVMLMTPAAELKPGDADFMAHVTKDGKDVEDAKVNLDLTMPSMQMDGPHVELKHSTGNAYEGTANVMASPYVAKVDVSGSAGKGTASFDFTVK